MGRYEDRSVNPFPEAPAEAELELESAVPDALLGRECEPRLRNLVRNPETSGMIGSDLGVPLLQFPAAAVEPLSNEMVAAAAAALLEDSRDLASASGRCSDFSASTSEKDSNTGSGDQDPSLKVRLMCSMGGEILLRPGDGKLRHVGGETRIVSVTRRIRLGGLMDRLTSLYGRAVGSIKYQAAGGGLDALVPVASDVDVEAMMEDYQKLSAGGGVSRLRLFLSPPSNLPDTPSMHKSGGGGGVLQSPSHMKQNGTFKLTVEPLIIRNPHLSTTLDNSAENKHEAYKAQINRLSPSSTENPFFGTVSLANNEEGSRHRDPCLSTTLDNCIQNKREPYQAQIKRLLPSSTEDPFFGTVSLANNEEGSRHGEPPHLSTTLDNSVEIKHEPSKAPIDRLSPSSAGNSFSGTASLQNNEEGSRHEDPHLSANLDNSVKNKHEPYESQIDRLLSSSVANPFLGTVSLQANEGGRHGDPHLSTSLDNSIKNKHKPYEAQIDRLASSSTENPFFGTVSLPDNEDGSRHGDPHLSTTLENSVKNKYKPYEAQIDRLSSSSPGNPFLGSVSLQNNDEGSKHGDCHLSTSLDNSVEIKRLSSSSPANPFLGTISLPNNEEGSRHGSGHGDPHLFTGLENSVETKQEPYEARIDRLSFSSAANPFLGTISLQDGEEGRNADPHLFTSLENSVENKHEPYKAQIDGLSSSSGGNPFLLATVSLQDEEEGSEHESRDGNGGHGDPHLYTSKENSVENKQEEGCKAWMDGLSSCMAGNPFLGTVCLQDDEEGLRNGRGHWDFLQQKKKPESVENSAALLSLLSGTDRGDQTYRENWLASNCMDLMENNQGSAKQVLPLPSLEESYTFPSVNPQRRTSLNEEPMSFSPFNGSSSSLSWGLPDIPLTETAQLISFDNAKSTDSTLWNSKLSLDELLGLTVNPPGETSLPELDRFGSGYEKEEKIATDGNSSVDFFSIQMEGASGTPYYREGKAIGGIDLNLLPPTECPLAVADSLKSQRATRGGGEEEEAARASLDSMNASNAILSERNKGEPIFPVFDSLLAGEEQELWLKQQVGVLDSNGRSSRIPTLSIQNWDKMLTQTEMEEEIIVNGELSDAASDDFKTDLGSEKEDNSDELLVDETETMNSVPGDLAARAEEEAIARGLQTIKNIDLEEQRELGSGTFGTVYHGKWRGTDVAIKRLKSSCFTGRASERDRLMADFWREAIILSQLHHPNVVAFYGVVTDGPDGTLATINEYMVNGSLKQVLRRKDRSIDRRKRLLIAMDAAFGMEYLHGKRIVHFDLKCENLLVNMRDPQRPICKVGDLGLSKIKQQTMVSGGVRGTLPWMAPELLNGSSSLVSEKVDVYSFGIVMWELLTGKEPYANMHYGAIIGGIVNNTLRPPIPSSCDPAWRSLMQRSWSADLAERPSFSEIAAELRLMADSLQPRGRAQA